MTPTLDPGVFILEKTDSRTVYQTTTGETWEITGTCNACGECEVGAVDTYYADTIELHYQIWTGVPVGEPGACFDSRFGSRLDIPVRPELTDKMDCCVLSGRYLSGN